MKNYEAPSMEMVKAIADTTVAADDGVSLEHTRFDTLV